MKTYTAKPDDIRRDWYVVNAAGKTLGRLATEIAKRLRGKHKAEYTPHVDTGDYIVVINAKDVRVSGNKRFVNSRFTQMTNIITQHNNRKYWRFRKWQTKSVTAPEDAKAQQHVFF